MAKVKKTKSRTKPPAAKRVSRRGGSAASPKTRIVALPELVRAPSQLPIVGIGASAGGLEALEQFIAKVPADCGMAFVIV